MMKFDSKIAISISECSDLEARGYSKVHLEDAMTEVARTALSSNIRLMYGGDLREGGFTELLFELVTKYANSDNTIVVENYLAWPVHSSISKTQIFELKKSLEGLAELRLMDGLGNVIGHKSYEKKQSDPLKVSEKEWCSGLTAMRKSMTASCAARICIGGRTEGYRGNMPGVAEEALEALKQKKPLYLIGAYGGCTDLIASVLKGDKHHSDNNAYLKCFENYGINSLENGLSEDDNKRIMTTNNIDEIIILLIKSWKKLKLL